LISVLNCVIKHDLHGGDEVVWSVWTFVYS
jgi:hypothetical protein